MYHIHSTNFINRTQWYIDKIENLMTTKGIKICKYDKKVLMDSLKAIQLKISQCGLDLSTFNFNSNQQLLNKLCRHYGLDESKISKFTDVVEIVGDDELLDLISRFRSIKSTLSSINHIEENLDKDGFVHPSLSITKSNRIMYVNPSILNIPKEILWEIIDKTDNNSSLYSVDINSQEPTILLNLNNKDFLKEVGNNDVYTYIYEQSVGLPCDTPKRNNTKKVINLLNYGGSLKLAIEESKALEETEVRKIASYYNDKCMFKSFTKYCTALAKNKVPTITNYLGTKLEVSGDSKARARTIQNLFIQSVGADIISSLAYHFDSEIQKLGLTDKIRLYFTRIDELILEVDNSIEHSTAISILKSIFEHQVDDWVAFKLSISKIK